MVLGLCRLLLGDADDAEDATQQVFLAAHRSVRNGCSPHEPAPWLAAIARNECRARIRSRRRGPSELPLLSDAVPDPVAAAVCTVDLDALWQALAELPRRQREAFLLRELGGLSYRELGNALGVTQPAVESLLFRARRRLRNTMTVAGAIALPAPLRDQLARLLPAFAPSSPATAATKCAAVAVGLGLGATAVVELPEHQVRPAPVQSPAVDVKPVVRPRHAARASVPRRVPFHSLALATHVPVRSEVRRDRVRAQRGRRDHQSEVDREPQPSAGRDGSSGHVPEQDVQTQPEPQEQAGEEHAPQTPEGSAPAPAAGRDVSGGDMTDHGDDGSVPSTGESGPGGGGYSGGDD